MHDEVSHASTDPHQKQDQRGVMKDKVNEDPYTTIKRRREAHRQLNGRANPAIEEPVLGIPRSLPYEIGCSSFTHELRKVRWPSSRALKPELSDKLEGKIQPYESLDI